ncbi:MAG: putative acetyltransferase [Solirubrobacteraceae bacterium]|nr:putative acetyltransferase [Solirubrobacteraceae bacterium]
MWEVRAETPADFDAIADVHVAAFAPSVDEAALVEALRAADEHVAQLCLVALRGGEVAGHVAFSRAKLESGDPILVLGPLGVRPTKQGQGAGSALVKEGMRRAAGVDFALVVVLGRPEFYESFGFELADAVGVEAPFEAPSEAWMAFPLATPSDTSGARGRIVFPESFRSFQTASIKERGIERG